MKALHKTKKYLIGMTAVLLLVQPFGAAGATLEEKLRPDGEGGVSFDYSKDKSFDDVMTEYAESGYARASESATFSVEGGNFSKADDGVVVEARDDYSKALVWNDETEVEKVEWKIKVPEDGLYKLTVSFNFPDQKYSDAVRLLTLDGELPFSECSNIRFRRLWKDDEVNTDELITKRPGVHQLSVWQTLDIYDSDCLYEMPLQFYLTKGSHVFGMEMVSGSLIVGRLTFSGYTGPVSYEEYSAENSQYPSGTSTVYFEAESENILYKNSNIIRMSSTGNPQVTPKEIGETVMNVIGGTAWQNGGTAVTYEINVEPGTGGMYKMAFHLLQNYRDGLPSFRSIEIDGEVPFTEMQAYLFSNGNGWRTETLTDSSGDPYLFYLEDGKHTITLRCVQGPMKGLLSIIEADSLHLSELSQQIRLIIGQNPDYNYDYELERVMPDLMSDLKEITDRMQTLKDQLNEVAGTGMAMYHQLTNMIEQIEKMISNPFTIPQRMDDLSNIISTYSTWLTSFRSQPLLLDFVEVLPENTAATERRTNFFEKLWVGVVNFVNSFTKDYENISGSNADVEITEELDVWIGRGTDWAQLIKDMADEDFTTKTGVKVNVNVLPSGQLTAGSANALMLAVASGKTPDVCLGAALGEFAMRDTLVDISQFEDYEEVKSRFLEELFVLLTYKGGVYGLPETMNFMVMAYRKDILSRLGLKLPETWEELYHNVIPVLSQNNMQFYLAHNYEMFLYQYGGQLYTDDLMYTAMDTPEAYQAFKELCELYTLYGVPVTANFYNRFRTGESPIGVIDYATFMTIRGAAPELDGMWGITLVPGHRQEDGTVNHAISTASAEFDMIMKGCKNPETAWKFLKWWTGAEVQSQFGNEIEALRGTTARWNSANLDAFSDMSWSKKDLSVIMQSVQQFKAAPLVLGNYYTTRHINNAYNRCVVSGMDPRDSLEEAVVEINRELKRRRESINK